MNFLLPHVQKVLTNNLSAQRTSVDECMPHVIRCLMDEYVMGQGQLSEEIHLLLEAWTDSLSFSERLSVNALLNPLRQQRDKYRDQAI